MKDTLLAYIRARHFSAVARTYFDLLLVDGTEQAKLFIRTLFIYNPPSQKKQKKQVAAMFGGSGLHAGQKVEPVRRNFVIPRKKSQVELVEVAENREPAPPPPPTNQYRDQVVTESLAGVSKYCGMRHTLHLTRCTVLGLHYSIRRKRVQDACRARHSSYLPSVDAFLSF